jgi:hypothetical protein
LPDAGSGILIDAAAFFVHAGVVVNRADVVYHVSGNQAIGKVARRRALDRDAIERLDVSDDIVGRRGSVRSKPWAAAKARFPDFSASTNW